MATDVATGWTECAGVWGKRQRAVFAALTALRGRLPRPLLGIDADNGSEFLNALLLRSCAAEALTFARSRPSWKNDQAHGEQKTWSVVRRLVGYARYESEAALAQLNAVYDLLRLWTDLGQPSLELVAKQRDDTPGKTCKTYDAGQTPYRRLLASGVLAADPAQQQALAETFAASGPLAPRSRLAAALDGLARLQERRNDEIALASVG